MSNAHQGSVGSFCTDDLDEMTSNGSDSHEVKLDQTWADIAQQVENRDRLARMIARYGCDPDGRYGLELARYLGDERLVRTASRQILDDWDQRDPDVQSFINSRPLIGKP